MAVRRGARLCMAVPHSHWNTATVVAGLIRRGMIATFVPGGPIDRDAFEAYVARVVVPELHPATSSSWRTSPTIRGRGSAP